MTPYWMIAVYTDMPIYVHSALHMPTALTPQTTMELESTTTQHKEYSNTS